MEGLSFSEHYSATSRAITPEFLLDKMGTSASLHATYSLPADDVCLNEELVLLRTERAGCGVNIRLPSRELKKNERERLDRINIPPRRLKTDENKRRFICLKPRDVFSCYDSIANCRRRRRRINLFWFFLKNFLLSIIG